MPEMALYVDEEEIWKCPKHPSRRRRCGICHVCLRERLGTLCPECANVRPCSCCSTAAMLSSSSSSSFSSLFSRFSGGDGVVVGVGSVGRVSNLIESEPSLRRSRSVAIPFLRSRSRFVGDKDSEHSEGSEPHTAGGGGGRRKTTAFWSVFKSQKSKRGSPPGEETKKVDVKDDEDDASMRKTMMMRSRSVAVPMTTENGAGYSRPTGGKGRSWYFPSPIKVFRQSKISKLVRTRSPLYRG